VKKIFLSVVTILLVAIPVAASRSGKACESPDGALIATINPVGLAERDSRVEILSRNPLHLLRVAEYLSANNAQPSRVVKGEWTSDGQFFVYSLMDSEKTDNTEFPTYFYSRKLNEIRSIDAALGGSVANAQFTLIAPNQIKTEILKNGLRKHVKVDLSTLEKTTIRPKATPASL
jgi:hypothetical protein